MREIKLSDITGIQVGQAQNVEGATGCSVILCKNGGVCGVDVRGGGPATRETDLLDPVNMVESVHGVVLSGGSAFGLDASAGVMQYLEEHKCGFDMKVAYIPIVVGASLFDLSVGNPMCRPDKQMGYDACVNSEQNELLDGNYGAGTGASVGKLMGFDHAMKSGQGSYGVQVANLQVAALSCVNACGNVYDFSKNEMLAGTYDYEHKIQIPLEALIQMQEASQESSMSNTTISCVVTNAKLTKAQCNKIASVAHDGYARSIMPVHMMSDGDTIFVLSTGEVEANTDVVAMLAADCIKNAIHKGVTSAEAAYGLTSYKELHK